MKQLQCCMGVVVALCLACSMPVAQTIELRLEYERFPDNRMPPRFLPYGDAHIELLAEAPEGDWKLPTLYGDPPLYGWLKIGDQARLLVVDQRGKRSGFYDRIYLDINADGDLINGLVVDAKESRHSGQTFDVTFPAVDIPTLVDGVSLSYSFSPELYYYTLAPLSWGAWFKNLITRRYVPQKPFHLGNLNLRYGTNCMYTTMLELEGDEYLLYLNDNNGNGRFDDWGTPVEQDEDDSRLRVSGDRLYLTHSDTRMDYDHRMTLGKYLYLKDRLYELDISLADNRVRLTPFADEVVTIELPMPVHRIVMIGSDASVMAYRPESRILAPPGAYRVLDYMAYCDEPGGARWQLNAYGTWDSPVLTAAAGAAVEYTIGEPFRPMVVVPWWARYNSEEVYLSLDVVGAAGEIISGLRCIQNAENSRIPLSDRGLPKAPTFKIVKMDGEVVFQGSFEYG